jgi:transposase
LTSRQPQLATQTPNLLETHKRSSRPPPLLTANFSSSIIVMGRISEDTRNSILSLIDSGLSSRKIAARLGVGHTTVNRVRARARPGVQKCRAGAPAKLTKVDKRILVRMITSGKADNAVQLTRQLKDIANMKCSPQTVRCALKEVGLKAMSKKRSRDFCLDTSASATSSP